MRAALVIAVAACGGAPHEPPHNTGGKPGATTMDDGAFGLLLDGKTPWADVIDGRRGIAELGGDDGTSVTHWCGDIAITRVVALASAMRRRSLERGVQAPPIFSIGCDPVDRDIVVCNQDADGPNSHRIAFRFERRHERFELAGIVRVSRTHETPALLAGYKEMLASGMDCP